MTDHESAWERELRVLREIEAGRPASVWRCSECRPAVKDENTGELYAWQPVIKHGWYSCAR
jgi:hypothetical protein